MMRTFFCSISLLLCLSSTVAFRASWRFATTILSKPLPMSSVEESGTIVHQIFIGNLPFTVDEDALRSAVDEKLGGSVSYKSMRLQTDKRTGKSRGFAYFHFFEKSMAEEALALLSGLQVGGREAKVDLSEPRAERPKLERTPQENSVFIGNLDFAVQEEQLIEMCSRPRGFGHIDFKSEEFAKKAISVLNGVMLQGRELRVDLAQRRENAGAASTPFGARSFGDSDSRPPRRENKFADRAPREQGAFPPKNSVFIGNLAWDMTQEMAEEMLNDVLGPQSYSRVRLATDRETGRPRGFGHIDFKDAATAERAITELNGLEVLGRPLRVDFAGKK
eukprot:gene31661-42220_t